MELGGYIKRETQFAKCGNGDDCFDQRVDGYFGRTPRYEHGSIVVRPNHRHSTRSFTHFIAMRQVRPHPKRSFLVLFLSRFLISGLIMEGNARFSLDRSVMTCYDRLRRVTTWW